MRGLSGQQGLEQLANELFPPNPTPSATAMAEEDSAADEEEAALEQELRRLIVRRRHGAAHAWVDGRDDEGARAEAAEAHAEAAAVAAAPPGHEALLRVPREHDRTALLQTLAIKDALLGQMEAALLLAPPTQSTTVHLSRRVQALLANARRREAVMACKLKALQREVHNFRVRELAAVQLNKSLRRQLRDALRDVDAIAMRREVRTLRADLAASLAREAELGSTLQQVRSDAEHAHRVGRAASIRAYAADAMGVPTYY